MHWNSRKRRILLALVASLAQPALAEPVVIGHAGLQALDLRTLQRIYTGKVVEVDGVRVSPVNLAAGNTLRQRFLARYLDQDDDKYIGYWTVRRYVGKGTPPRELSSPQDIIDYVNKTTGAIGYIDSSDLTPELNVLLERP